MQVKVSTISDDRVCLPSGACFLVQIPIYVLHVPIVVNTVNENINAAGKVHILTPTSLPVYPFL